MVKIYKKKKSYIFILCIRVLIFIVWFINSNSFVDIDHDRRYYCAQEFEDIEIDNMSKEQKNIALCKAAFNDDKPRVEKLIIRGGANINYYDEENTTPLILAVRRQNKEITKLLLDLKANPNMYVSAGSAFLFAATTNNLPLIQLLCENNADIHRTSVIGETPLMLAVSNHLLASERAVALLLDLGSDLDAITPDGRTALTIAREKYKELARDYARIIWLFQQRQKTATNRQKFIALNITNAINNMPLDIANIISQYTAAKFSEDPASNPENAIHGASLQETPKNSSLPSSSSSTSSSSKCLIM